jgi:cytochrome d ubiquinol oxidase subunit II
VAAPGGGGFVRDYIAPWLSPFTASVGIFTLLLFAYLAAVYLTVEAGDPALRDDFRRRALGAGVMVFAAAMCTLALAWEEAPLVWTGLVTAPRAIAVHLLTGTAAIVALWALWNRRYPLARGAVIAQVTLIIWGWALAQFPWILPPTLSISDAAAPAITLKLTLGALAIGAAVLFPSLYYLFKVFKSTPP